jgi:diguanylate cyclase (GGDEF)-like protein/PAS domain S-box-containing protein
MHTTPAYGTPYICGFDQDVTDLISDERSFERERDFRFVTDNIRDVVFRCSAQAQIEFVSKSVVTLLGYRPEELLGKPARIIVHPDDLADGEQQIATQIAQKQSVAAAPSEHRLMHKNGTPVWVEHAPRLVFDSNANFLGWVDVVRDITERRASDARMKRMARHDALTDLPNRVVLNEHLDSQLGQSSQPAGLAVLCMDLDRFKAVNDTLGHQVGDELLKEVAERLRQTSERYGGFISRLGGDEFVAVLASSDKHDAERMAQDLITNVSKGYSISGQRVDVGLSVGIAFAPEDASDPGGLLRAGDLALYRAKAQGRGISCQFERRMDESRQARRRLEIELREAIDGNAFELFYQPIVDIKSGETVAMEALLRWRAGSGQMLLPAAFIPIAEETGLIIPLGEWVLREACSAAVTWPETVKLAINLSPVQLRKADLLATVVSALEQSGLPPARLELEITEGALLGDDEVTFTTMHELKNLGARIALDDFGTGYASLGYLQRFPFDKLKIDGSFVRNLQNGAEAKAIVCAVIALADALGMVTTGEGVETLAQYQSLHAERCVEAQGYFLSVPLRAKEIEAFLHQPKPNRKFLQTRHEVENLAAA